MLEGQEDVKPRIKKEEDASYPPFGAGNLDDEPHSSSESEVDENEDLGADFYDNIDPDLLDASK